MEEGVQVWPYDATALRMKFWWTQRSEAREGEGKRDGERIDEPSVSQTNGRTEEDKGREEAGYVCVCLSTVRNWLSWRL